MKTNNLIDMLSAQSAQDVPPKLSQKSAPWKALALLLSVALSVLMMLDAVGLNPALLSDMRVGTPSKAIGRWHLAALGAIGLLWLAAVWQAFGLAQDEQLSELQGVSWQECSMWIAYLSAPMFLVLIYAQKLRAPTRPALAGAACGAVAGALGAAVYALHCPEYGLMFIAVWYVLGMIIPTVLGAILGDKFLRW
jgi:hypothetical protein